MTNREARQAIINMCEEAGYSIRYMSLRKQPKKLHGTEHDWGLSITVDDTMQRTSGSFHSWIADEDLDALVAKFKQRLENHESPRT